ncbi:shikimate dehydrogenase [bacterium]|nr:shikimate dehydrogenase [bacterium]
MLCAIVARQRHESLLAEMKTAVKRGAQLLELRLDFLKSEPRFGMILAKRKCPLIATIRRREEGGKWAGSEERRLQLLRAAIAEGFDYVDLEDDVAGQIPRFGQTKRIVSHHNMRTMPHHLPELWERMAKLDPDVIKIAGKAKKASDNFKMLSVVKNATIPTVAFCMDEVGMPSRLLCVKLGSPFTYSAFNPERIVAPGLLTFDTMRDFYNFDGIKAETEVYGVIGDPIAHSLSPLVHNAAYFELGMNRLYLPWQVSENNLPRFLEKLGIAGVRGLSVTIPHKEAILTTGQAGDPLVTKAGSANTIVIDEEGKRKLFNTDGPAAINSLEAQLPVDPATGHGSLKGRSVLVLGAGGVARTLAFSLHDRGALVTIASRTSSRSQALAQAVGCKFVDWAQRETVLVDVVINGTPVGMHPNVDDSPYGVGSMKQGMVFFDTVYNPMMTRMLRDAEERGAKVVTGVDMFVSQAEAQFEIFTGQKAPAGLMKELVLEELSPAKKMLREARLARRKKKT